MEGPAVPGEDENAKFVLLPSAQGSPGVRRTSRRIQPPYFACTRHSHRDCDKQSPSCFNCEKEGTESLCCYGVTLTTIPDDDYRNLEQNHEAQRTTMCNDLSESKMHVWRLSGGVTYMTHCQHMNLLLSSTIQLSSSLTQTNIRPFFSPICSSNPSRRRWCA